MTPPEVISGAYQFDRTFDIYHFGLTLYRMCNGDNVFYAQYATYGVGSAFDREKFRFDVRNGRFPDRKIFPAHIPTKLRNIIKKCMDPDPARRYPSAIDVANALAGVEGPNLDWRLTETPASKVWTKSEDGTIYELTVNADGSSTCYKTVSGGQRRRFGEGCKPSMSEADIQKFLGLY